MKPKIAPLNLTSHVFSSPLSSPDSSDSEGSYDTTPCPSPRTPPSPLIRSSSPLSSLPDTDYGEPLPFASIDEIPPTSGEAEEDDDRDGMDPVSSPLRGTKEERMLQKLQKTVTRRLKKQTEKENRRAEREAVRAAKKKAEQDQLDASISDTLAFMKTQNLNFGRMLIRISDPQSIWKRERYERFFSSPGRVKQVLDSWSSPQNNDTMRKAVDEWVMDYVTRHTTRESNQATASGVLLSHRKDVNEEFVTKYTLPELYDRVAAQCPRLYRILAAFCVAPRQRPDTVESALKKRQVNNNKARISLNELTMTQAIGSCLTVLLGTRSQRNSFARHLVGLYLYTSGAQRQVFNVLSHLGISCSYPTIVGQGTLKGKTHQVKAIMADTTNPTSTRDQLPEACDTQPPKTDTIATQPAPEDENAIVGDLEDEEEFDQGLDWSKFIQDTDVMNSNDSVEMVTANQAR